MQQLTLAYRDDDRTPVIFANREIARRHYALDVNVVRIEDGGEYEAALFTASPISLSSISNISTTKQPRAQR